MYYANKIESLQDIFGTSSIELLPDSIRVEDSIYPIVDDVIILLDAKQLPLALQKKIGTKTETLQEKPQDEFSQDIQYTFSEEWKSYPDILPEHKSDFLRYFGEIDLTKLANSRVCDLGCGIGRWSYFLHDSAREMVLMDFSEAIFVARNNLRKADNALFFMGDLLQLPFRDGFADFLFCLGVLHHLPVPCLQAVRDLKPLAPRLLIYLYYSLDNRPLHFRIMLALATMLRNRLAQIKSTKSRSIFTAILTYGIYLPLILLGNILKPLGLSRFVPIYEGYTGRGVLRIKQDVYDRFFTGIEQRVSRKEIMELEDTFSKITVFEGIPYWHFLCERGGEQMQPEVLLDA
jgi:SAM-dependent methyltransferase